jgi:hypothetical protein
MRISRTVLFLTLLIGVYSVFCQQKHGERMPEYQWIKITENAGFAPRDGAGAIVFKNRMWLFGGWNPSDKVHFPKTCNNEVWSSKDGKKWNLITYAPWEVRHTAGYIVFKGYMWIIGGDANQHHYQNDIWKSSDGINWECVSDNVAWSPRVLHYTVVFKDKIWVIGGQTLPQFAPAPEIFYSDVWCSEDGKNWKKVADNCEWAPRGMIGGGTVFKGRIWICGGGTYDTPGKPERIFYNDVWSSKDGINWESVCKNTPWHPRQYHDVAVFDGKLWVMEGYHREGGNRKDVWYSEDGKNWIEVPDTPWPARHAASVFVYDNALWMVAGNNMTPDVWKLVRIKK